LILGVDIARFGNNATVAQFRRGRDARTIPAAIWRGLDVVQVANRVAGLIAEKSPDAVFVDEGGVGGGVVDVLRSLGHSVIPVNFGVPPSTRPGGTLVANKRAEMFVTLREWLREGGCIDPSEDLNKELISIEYHFNKKQEIQLMTKEDMRAIGRESPDWADALAITFAYPVAPKIRWQQDMSRGRFAAHEYDPYSYEKLTGT
jgi:phage terminase large subunit